jgi:Cu/Ag efflux protein CusF
VAQTPSATASSSPTVVIDKDIQLLKDKIANKVSEIRKQNNKAVSGFVSNIDGNTMKLNNNGEVNQVKFDENLTKVFRVLGTTKKEIKTSDILKNDYVIVSGVVADNVITANVVLIDENFLVDSGKITEINKESYNIKVLISDKDTYSLDIETSTKQYMVNIKTLSKETIGFSKLKEGDTIHFVVKKTGEAKNNNYSATKILIIPQEYFIK